MEWTKIRSLESKILYFFQWKIVLNKDPSKEGFKVLTIHVKWLSRNFCVNTMLLNQTGLLRLGFTYVNWHHAVLFPNRIFLAISAITKSEGNKRLLCSVPPIIALFEIMSRTLVYTKFGNSNGLKFKMLVGVLELPLFTKIFRKSSYEVLHSKQPSKTFWNRHLLLELTTTSCYEMYCEIGVRLFQMSYWKIVKQNSCYYI